jgi:hypothetical protein
VSNIGLGNWSESNTLDLFRNRCACSSFITALVPEQVTECRERTLPALLFSFMWAILKGLYSIQTRQKNILTAQ